MASQIKDGVDVYAEIMKRLGQSIILIENILFLLIRWEWTGKFKTGKLFCVVNFLFFFVLFKGTLNPNCSAKVPCHGWKPFGKFEYTHLYYLIDNLENNTKKIPPLIG